MADLVTWRGSSGSEYMYWSLEVNSRMRAREGNYIFAKRDPTGGWVAVYVGQGNLASRANVREHYKGELILSKGATHVHVRVNTNLLARMTEWADLLKGHPEAYAPSGCNGGGATAGRSAGAGSI
jgi:hypothetical protein